MLKSIFHEKLTSAKTETNIKSQQKKHLAAQPYLLRKISLLIKIK